MARNPRRNPRVMFLGASNGIPLDAPERATGHAMRPPSQSQRVPTGGARQDSAGGRPPSRRRQWPTSARMLSRELHRGARRGGRGHPGEAGRPPGTCGAGIRGGARMHCRWDGASHDHSAAVHALPKPKHKIRNRMGEAAQWETSSPHAAREVAPERSPPRAACVGMTAATGPREGPSPWDRLRRAGPRRRGRHRRDTSRRIIPGRFRPQGIGTIDRHDVTGSIARPAPIGKATLPGWHP